MHACNLIGLKCGGPHCIGCCSSRGAVEGPKMGCRPIFNRPTVPHHPRPPSPHNNLESGPFTSESLPDDINRRPLGGPHRCILPLSPPGSPAGRSNWKHAGSSLRFLSSPEISVRQSKTSLWILSEESSAMPLYRSRQRADVSEASY